MCGFIINISGNYDVTRHVRRNAASGFSELLRRRKKSRETGFASWEKRYSWASVQLLFENDRFAQKINRRSLESFANILEEKFVYCPLLLGAKQRII